MAKINPIDFQKALKGVSYPAEKQDLVSAASDNDAGEDIKRAIEALSDKRYDSPADVTEAADFGSRNGSDQG